MAPHLDILYVITKATWGGAQRYVYDLALAMHKEGRTVAVAYGTPGLLIDRLSVLGIRTIPIPGMGRDIKVRKDMGAYQGLKKIFRDERPRIVHLNSSKAGGLGALAARMTHVPRIIFTAHGWAWNENRSFVSRLLIRVVAWLTVILSHKTICVSNAMRRDAAWMLFTGYKLLVIKNGIAAPPLFERAAARETLMRAAPRGIWVGMLSELHPVKQVHDAIRAFAKIANHYPDASLLIMGEGEERKSLEALVHKEKLEERVFLLGFIPDGSSYLSAFDIFLHTSRSESFGYAVAEAGCAALPVVATRVGALPEIITDATTGTLVPNANVEAIASGLSGYLDDEEKRVRHGRALKTLITHEYAIERMIGETAALYA